MLRNKVVVISNFGAILFIGISYFYYTSFTPKRTRSTYIVYDMPLIIQYLTHLSAGTWINMVLLRSAENHTEVGIHSPSSFRSLAKQVRQPSNLMGHNGFMLRILTDIALPVNIRQRSDFQGTVACKHTQDSSSDT